MDPRVLSALLPALTPFGEVGVLLFASLLLKELSLDLDALELLLRRHLRSDSTVEAICVCMCGADEERRKQPLPKTDGRKWEMRDKGNRHQKPQPGGEQQNKYHGEQRQ